MAWREVSEVSQLARTELLAAGLRAPLFIGFPSLPGRGLPPCKWVSDSILSEVPSSSNILDIGNVRGKKKCQGCFNYLFFVDRPGNSAE